MPPRVSEAVVVPKHKKIVIFRLPLHTTETVTEEKLFTCFYHLF